MKPGPKPNPIRKVVYFRRVYPEMVPLLDQVLGGRIVKSFPPKLPVHAGMPPVHAGKWIEVPKKSSSEWDQEFS